MAGDNIFTQIVDAVKGDVKKNEGKDVSNNTGSTPAILNEMEGFYSTDPTDVSNNAVRTNWYRQRPYAFVFTNRSGEKSTFYLPIAPSNINIVTHFATNVISTMYGTVEEHSEQRYYDITISGTTGMSPRYWTTIEAQDSGGKSALIGRAGLAVNAGFNDVAGGFFKRTLSLLENTVNQASDLFGADKAVSGIDLKKTGYVAFHNFYKFLLAYKRDTSGEKGDFSQRTGHPLRFVNYKDNNQYDVSVQQFQLTRDAGEPFLYNYNITMRAYNLRNADKTDVLLDVKDRKEALGLDGIKTSLRATMFNKAAQAKRAAYSAVNAAKGFGL